MADWSVKNLKTTRLKVSHLRLIFLFSVPWTLSRWWLYPSFLQGNNTKIHFFTLNLEVNRDIDESYKCLHVECFTSGAFISRHLDLP